MLSSVDSFYAHPFLPPFVYISFPFASLSPSAPLSFSSLFGSLARFKQTGVNLWAECSYSSFDDQEKMQPKVVRTEGLYMNEIDEKHIEQHISNYRAFIDRSATSSVEEVEEIEYIGLIRDLMSSCDSPELDKLSNLDKRENARSESDEISAKQSLLAMNLIEVLKKSISAVAEEGRSKVYDGKDFSFLNWMFAFMDDYLRWANETFSKLRSKSIEYNTKGKRLSLKGMVEDICMLGNDCRILVDASKEILSSPLFEKIGDDQAEKARSLQQKVDM